MAADHHHLIVIGSGPGGASLARRVAATGKRILILKLDNLYVADPSFFPSISAVNPTLTIIANALRVTDRIAERLK